MRDTTSVYLIGWVDYDPSFNFNRQAELEANRDNFVKGINAKLVTTRPTMIDGYSAIEFTAETDERIFKSRVYWSVAGPIRSSSARRRAGRYGVVNRFFNSFKVSLP